MSAGAPRLAPNAAPDVRGCRLPLLDGDGRSYTLSTKLGWDPRLVYRRGPKGAQWIFEPGDGSDEKVIDLRP